MENLKKLTVRASMRLSTSVQFFRELPIGDLMDIIEEIVSADEESIEK